MKSILKYFEDKSKIQDQDQVTSSNTSSNIPSATNDLMLQENSARQKLSADLGVKVTSASIFGGYLQSTSTRRRGATRTSSKTNNHGTSPEFSRAQLSKGKESAAMGTGYSDDIQGD